MKSQRNVLPVVVVALILLSTFSADCRGYAQSGTGELPGAKPTPTPKPGAKPAAKPAAPVTPTLVFDQEIKGRIDPRGSEKAASGGLFEDHILNAKSEDLLSFHLLSSDANLSLQLVDKDNVEIPIAKDQQGAFKINTPAGGLPADGEYRVRVVGAAKRTAAPFSLKVTRLGLTPTVYNERFNQIVINYRESDATSADEALAKLEELAMADKSKPGAFEFLGIIYLYNKNDVAKAEQAMEQAVQLNGAAIVKISYDAQWRRMARLKNGKTGWEEARTGWLRIRPGQVEITDPSNRILATVAGTQVKELSKILTASSNLINVTGERRQFVFEPGSGTQQEADLVIKLIQTHVMKRTN